MIHFLCIHGNFGSPAEWGRVTDTLARELGGASFDRPNLWTLSPAEPIDELAVLVASAKAKGRKVIVLGYSLGARLALELLARKDIIIDGAVLCSVNPGLTDSAARRDRWGADSRWAEKVGNLETPWPSILVEWNSQAVFAGSLPTTGLTFTSSAEERIVRSSIARRFRDWSLGVLSPRWSTLESAKCPVLCLAGEHDSKFRRILESIERLRNPRLVCGVLPGAGHRIVLDNPEALGTRIAVFVGTDVQRI